MEEAPLTSNIKRREEGEPPPPALLSSASVSSVFDFSLSLTALSL
jgi:hypothetical protein